MPHSEECRKRIEKSLLDDPEHRHRVQEASSKRQAFVDKHLSFRAHSEKRKRSAEDDGEDAVRGDDRQDPQLQADPSANQPPDEFTFDWYLFEQFGRRPWDIVHGWRNHRGGD